MAGTAPSKHSVRQVPGRRGVTFIELITLTIALLILLAIGVPRMSPVVQQFRLKGAAWQLAGDLRLARQRAVTTQRRFRVCLSICAITVPGGSYSVEVDVGTPGHANWTSETGAPARLPPDVTITTNATAYFTPNGMASGSTFTLTNLMGSYQVAVTPTGKVTVAVCTGTCP